MQLRQKIYYYTSTYIINCQKGGLKEHRIRYLTTLHHQKKITMNTSSTESRQDAVAPVQTTSDQPVAKTEEQKEMDEDLQEVSFLDIAMIRLWVLNILCTNSYYITQASEVFNSLFSTRRPKDGWAGISSGLKSATKGTVAGVASLIAQPIAGAQEVSFYYQYIYVHNIIYVMFEIYII